MRRSIRLQLQATFSILLIVLVLSSLWSVYNFNRLSNAIEGIMESNYKTVVAAQNMMIAIERQDSAELAMIFSEGEEAEKIFRENEIAFLKNYAVAEDNITEPGEAEILGKIENDYMLYLDGFSRFVKSGEGDLQERYYEELLPLFESTKDTARELLMINQEAMVNKRDRAQEVAGSAIASSLGISLIVAIFGLVISSYQSRRIVNPIVNLNEKMKQVAGGDYEQAIEHNRNDEIGELTDTFNQMGTQLQAYDRLNIAKLMKEKRKADSIVESISDGILVTDHEHRLILINRAAEKIFDLRESEVKQRHLLEVIRNEELFTLIKNVMDKEAWDYSETFDLSITRENAGFIYRVSARPIRTPDGESIGVVTLLQDITKLKEVEEIKDEFVATVSHEFRTPLTSMTMGMGLLLDEVSGPLTDNQREIVLAAQEDTDRLKRLVGELLDLSRLESGKINLEIKPHPLIDIVAYAVKPFRPQAEEKQVALSVQIDERLPKVNADFEKISWVLTNLIGNAFRYVKRDGTGSIEISAKETANKMIVSVHDNGKGIPTHLQKKIFDKFVQAQGENDDQKGSTGLGLAIAREMINAHGGHIWVNSEPGEGSTFSFTLHRAE